MNLIEHRATDLKQWKRKHQFVLDYPQFTNGQLDWLIRNRETNGFKAAFKRLGRSMIIHEGIFAECLAKKDES